MTIKFVTNIDRYKKGQPIWYGSEKYPQVGEYIRIFPDTLLYGHPSQLEVIKILWEKENEIQIELYYSKSQLELLKQSNLEL